MADTHRFFLPIYTNKRSFIYAGAALGAVAAGAMAMAEPESRPAAPLRHVLAASVMADGGEITALTGVVEPAVPAEASAATAGRVTRLLADIGDHVEAGQVIAILDDTPARARLQQASAELARARAQSAERATAADRALTMADGGALSAAERDAARAEARAAAAAVAAAEAQRRAAAHELAQGVVRAPSSGTIAQRLIAVGSMVAPGQKAFAIESDGDRIILAAAPQRLARQLQRGQVVRFTSNGQTGEGALAAIAPRVADGGVVPVKIAIRSGAPLSGSVVQLQVPVSMPGAGNVVRVPASAVMLDRNRRHFLYRLAPGNRAEAVTVRLIGLADSDARITADLLPGQRVVAAGGAFLANGQQLAVAQPGI